MSEDESIASVPIVKPQQKPIPDEPAWVARLIAIADKLAEK